MKDTFLVELGTEELPPKNLLQLIEAFSDAVGSGLGGQNIKLSNITKYATPRRLALVIDGLESETPSEEKEVWGPPAAIAFDAEGKPTKAAFAFAEKNGIDISSVQAKSDGKVEKLFARITIQGQKTTDLLEVIISNAIAKLPIAKRMKWGAKREEFVRPVHWLVMLYGGEVVKANILGLESGRTTRGHRFHYNQGIELEHAGDYASELETKGFVLADFDERRALIKAQVEAEAKKVGGVAVIDPALLDEVTALVEWPVALTGKFEERFLAVPAEALIASMKEHQKYFHVVDANGKLKNNFITVANIQSKDPSQIIDGNERVIRPRLSDAAFFFETDKKTTLASLRERLKTIVFQAQLGTIYDKTERVAGLAQLIAGKLNADAASAERAAQLCKSDLVTNMVGEFDDMQGIAGYYYALNDGENAEVAAAMNEQYMPRFAGDQLPQTITGTIIALADRLDTISGIFGIGQQPSGSKDPFALRRASIAVLRLLVEKNLTLDLRELLTFAKAQHKNLTVGDELVEQVLGYMLDRFRAMFEDAQIPAEVFQSVTAKQLSQPLDINQRVLAVNEFSKLPQAQALAAANKRVSNILAKQNAAPSTEVNASLLQEDAEKTLAQAVSAKAAVVAPLFAAREYTQALAALADLQQPVDAFFDSVMVMSDDPALQQNRLALLQQLRGLFLEVADISYLVPAKN
ncbi:MAG TPA: glycine--tRNA ligase subunit beta [Cellvibrio sp.]